MAEIKIYGKLRNVTESGKIADYEQIDGAPQILQAAGTSEKDTMSQKAIGTAINTAITEAITTTLNTEV